MKPRFLERDRFIVAHRELPKGVVAETVQLKENGRIVPAILLRPSRQAGSSAGMLWLHGGGYCLGTMKQVYLSRAVGLVRRFGMVVLCPGYRLALRWPYPAAIEDCYASLRGLLRRAEEFGVNRNQLMVGGESAGGGLTASLCMMARDRGEVKIAFQTPLYPMLDNLAEEVHKRAPKRDLLVRATPIGWGLYLRANAKRAVSPYASAARQTDYHDLPPAYTFVGNREPYYAETVAYIGALRAAGVEARADVYPCGLHLFDLRRPNWELSRYAALRFEDAVGDALKRCFAENG